MLMIVSLTHIKPICKYERLFLKKAANDIQIKKLIAFFLDFALNNFAQSKSSTSWNTRLSYSFAFKNNLINIIDTVEFCVNINFSTD